MASVKSTKVTTPAPKKLRSYPPYSEMINEAITSLKERTGSSQIAIGKFIEAKQKANLPNNFKKLLLVQLKKLVLNGKLVKVKNSFKLPAKIPSTAVAAAKKPKSTTTTATAKKPKSTAVAKKVKSASTNAAAKKANQKVKKPVAKLGKSPAKKRVVAAKSKKPKSIKTPVKKVSVNKAKK